MVVTTKNWKVDKAWSPMREGRHMDKDTRGVQGRKTKTERHFRLESNILRYKTWWDMKHSRIRVSWWNKKQEDILRSLLNMTFESGSLLLRSFSLLLSISRHPSNPIYIPSFSVHLPSPSFLSFSLLFSMFEGQVGEKSSPCLCITFFFSNIWLKRKEATRQEVKL